MAPAAFRVAGGSLLDALIHLETMADLTLGRSSTGRASVTAMFRPSKEWLCSDSAASHSGVAMVTSGPS